HLQLVRAAGRAREMAVRAALGASRGRILRQLLAESTVLSALGGAAGLIVAIVFVRLLVAFAPADVPRIHGVGIDGGGVAFLPGVTLVAALVSGVAPALTASRLDLGDALKDGGRGTSEGRGRGRARQLLVASEFAMALVLV